MQTKDARGNDEHNTATHVGEQVQRPRIRIHRARLEQKFNRVIRALRLGEHGS